MSKKEEFKEFAKDHPELVTHIKNGTNTWQDFYEIYDIYGNNNEAWQDYFKKPERPQPINRPISATLENKVNTTTSTTSNTNSSLSSITDIFKKADLGSIQKHIGTAQKAIGLFQEFTAKDAVAGGAGAAAGALGSLASKGPSNPRPLNKFFED